MRIAITREVSSQIGRCELSFQERRPIDVEVARAQHRQYQQCLTTAGCMIHRLSEEPDLPDSVFVEDTAIVLEEQAIVTRPRAGSRRPEVESIARCLSAYRRLDYIREPATLDGGDVLLIGKRMFVGLSQRSNMAAIDQLRELLSGSGYSVAGVPVQDCLHLKSAVTEVADDTLLINRRWVDAAAFAPMRLIEVDPGEPNAANALRIANIVIYPSHYPATRKRLAALGLDVRAVDASELAKAEGGVTCCSLIFSI